MTKASQPLSLVQVLAFQCKSVYTTNMIKYIYLLNILYIKQKEREERK
jgi:hypothetical protein